MTFTTLPAGPERDARNEGFRRTREKMDLLDWTNLSDDLLRESWEEFLFSFGYDAYDAADEWWVNWGLTYERMNAARGQLHSRPGSTLFIFAEEDETDPADHDTTAPYFFSGIRSQSVTITGS